MHIKTKNIPMRSPDQPNKKKSGNSNLWMMVLLIVAGFGLGIVAGYCFYSEINQIMTNLHKGKPVTHIAETESKPNDTDKANTENALNQQTEALSAQPETAAAEQSQSNVGSSPKATVLGVFYSRPEAERNGKRLQEEMGIANEIIDKGNQIYWVSAVLSQGDMGGGKIGTILGTFPTRPAAERYGKRLNEEMGIDNEVIEKGMQLFWVVSATLDKDTDPAPQIRPEPQGNVGGGKYVLIISSLPSRSEAESFGKKLQAEGIAYEIIEAANQRYRISVASFDDRAEAQRQADQMKSRPYCKDVWIASR